MDQSHPVGVTVMGKYMGVVVPTSPSTSSALPTVTTGFVSAKELKYQLSMSWF